MSSQQGGYGSINDDDAALQEGLLQQVAADGNVAAPPTEGESTHLVTASSKSGESSEHHHHSSWWGASGLCRRPRLLVDWMGAEGEAAGVRNSEGEERHISWSELFFDLIYVTAIARLGDELRGDGGAEPLTFLDYFSTFQSVYATWVHTCLYATRWFNDDLVSKVWMASLMVGVTVLCTRVSGGIQGDNLPIFVFTCAVLRLLLSLPYFSVAYFEPKYRANTLEAIGWIWVEGILYVAAGVVTDLTARRVLFLSAALGMYFRFCIFQFITFTCKIRVGTRPPPVDLEHWCERVGLFLIIVLGESINGISVNVNSFPPAFWFALVFGFFVVFNTKLLYFDVDPKTLDHHACRISLHRALAWTTSHIILFCGAAVTGSGIAMACALAGDAAEYRSPERARWYMAGGQGAVLIALSVIRLVHHPPGFDLPAGRRERPIRAAVAADVLQVAMGAVAIAIPFLFDAKQLPDDALLGILASFAFVNVSVNLAVRAFVQTAEDAYDRDLKCRADAGDKAACREKQRRNSVTTLEDGFTLNAVTAPSPIRRPSIDSNSTDADDNIETRGRSRTVHL